MSFDKEYPNRKDRRKAYPKNSARAVDPSCRSHGGCPACEQARKRKDVWRGKATGQFKGIEECE